MDKKTAQDPENNPDQPSQSVTADQFNKLVEQVSNLAKLVETGEKPSSGSGDGAGASPELSQLIKKIDVITEKIDKISAENKEGKKSITESILGLRIVDNSKKEKQWSDMKLI